MFCHTAVLYIYTYIHIFIKILIYLTFNGFMLNVKFSARFSIPSISNQFKRVTQFICFIHERNRIINE